MKEKIIIIIIVLLFKYSHSQINLVPNPGFETYTTCPNNSDQLNYAQPWFRPSTGTPDYYNACALPITYFNVPVTSVGYCPAQSGNGMAGFLTSETVLTVFIYREYLAVKLLNQLTTSTKYYVTYHCRLADSSRYASKSVNIFFKNDSVSKNTYDTINANPQIVNPTFVTSKNNWTKLRGSFTSNGTEKYMYIGNFKPTVTNDTLFVTGGGRKQYYNMPYYFIDNICVSTDSTFSENWITNISENENKNEIKIYPNPVKSALYIEGLNQLGELRLFNVLSEEVNFTIENNYINFENLNTGFYFLNYKTTNNKTYKYKIVKE